MINFFYDLNPFVQTLIASLITLLCTSLGALSVFMFKNISNKIMQMLLGIASGVMLAAAIFSLLIPSIDESLVAGLNPYIVLSIGVLLGCIFLVLGDILIKKTNTKNNGILLIVAIILHNIPEGLSIGFAFGSITNASMISGALSLAIGIAIQNIPEGAAISLPLLKKGVSKRYAFLIGVLSGIVEPISAMIGFVLVSNLTTLLPYLLAFAAGAMIFVVIKELIPESNKDNSNLITLITIISFVLMMLLEI